MKYRKLDADGDMTFGHGSEDFYVDCAEAVAQAILTRLRLWKGEWYLDTTEGTPWLEDVLGKGTEGTALRALRERILETEGVREIEEISYDLDHETRQWVFSVTVETDFGEIAVHG